MLRGVLKTWVLMVLFTFTETDACTNFCLDTPDGPVFGCNLDLFIPGDGLVFINRRGIRKTGFEPGTTGRKAEWTSEYGSVTFNLAGREWAFGGMNEAGLVLSSMEMLGSVLCPKDARPPLPIGPWAQYILDTCGSIEDVLPAARQVRMEDAAPPVHYLIADSSGACITIEWIGGELVAHKGESLPVKALSNSFYHEALTVYQKGGPRWWQSDRGGTNRRFARAADRNAGYSKEAEPNAIKYAFETLTHVVAAAHTKWNIVYDIAGRTIYFRSAASPALKYFSFDQLDFSCHAPMRMLDINAPVEGDVANAFKPYNHDVNVTMLVTLCARLQIPLSMEDAESFVNHLESFECVR